MKTFRTAAVIDPEGQLHLRGLPFESGDEVEVVLQGREKDLETPGRYPLRGLPIRYEEPFEPVAVGDWEAAS